MMTYSQNVTQGGAFSGETRDRIAGAKRPFPRGLSQFLAQIR